MNAKAEQLGELLLERQQMLVTAESCTGGLIAKLCTDIAGSSGWFDRGFVTYSNESKQQMLGVPADRIEQYGAVSEAIVEAMGEGALKNSCGNIAVAVSGIAGPGGGSPAKPVGMVCFSFQLKGNPANTMTRQFQGNRDQVRQAAAEYALDQLIALADQSLSK